MGTEETEWADFGGDATLNATTASAIKRSTVRRRTSGDISSTSSNWMTAPISSGDLKPLAPPHARSPEPGRARTRFSSSIPVQSVRKTASISSFSRKSITSMEDVLRNDLEKSGRTVSTSTADSSSDSDKEQMPPHQSQLIEQRVECNKKIPPSPQTGDRRTPPISHCSNTSASLKYTSHPKSWSEVHSPCQTPQPQIKALTTQTSEARGRGNVRSSGSERISTTIDPKIVSLSGQGHAVALDVRRKPKGRSTSRSRASKQEATLLQADKNISMSPSPVIAPGNSIAQTQEDPTRSRPTKSTNNAKVARTSRQGQAVALDLPRKTRGRSTSRSRPPQTTITVAAPRERSSSVPRSSSIPRQRSMSRSRLDSAAESPHSSGIPSSLPSLPSTNKAANSRTHRNRSRSASLTRISNEDRIMGSPRASPTKRAYAPPPSTYRTRLELREAASPKPGRRSLSDSDANSVRSVPHWSSVNDIGALDDTGGSSPLLDRAHKKAGLMEKLFGDTVELPTANRIIGSLGNEIRPRILLAATVYHNTATNLWIATINTNQRGVAKNPVKANKYLKAFSFPTEIEARESAIANAPPKIVPFNESPVCFCCKGKFAVFRRAVHCRNCGVCVCNTCATTWPAKALPDTYNLKNEAHVKVCRSCHSLSSSFKRALLQGDLEEAIALYGTGNINLRTPFTVSNKKDESMFPVHCAAEGGNLNILRWLIGDHYCPVMLHRCAGSNNLKSTRGKSGDDTPLLTSKGRSVLSIAVESLKVGMMRYLVVELGLSIYECKDLKRSLAALEAALTILPHAISQPTVVRRDIPRETRWDRAMCDDAYSEPSSLGVDEAQFVDESITIASRHSRASSRHGGESLCIICCDRKIDCVGTPCGHAVCCLECSSNLTLCPVCNDRGSFIKIFRP